jgi:DNA-binding XRE family transcriptional regulator
MVNTNIAFLHIILDIISFCIYTNVHKKVFMRTTPPMPIPVKRALIKLGDDIRSARIRRRITTTLMAQRALITRTTLAKVEKGDPAVSMGIYSTILFILGMASKLSELADIRDDEVGLALDEQRLPKRVRVRKVKD